MSTDRTRALQAVEDHITSRIQHTLDELDGMQASNADNAKSTAGDKHDTERAMVHMEMENLTQRLQQARRMLHELEAFKKIRHVPTEVISGSLVSTDRGVFLIGIACGRVSFNARFITGISIQSPLGKQLIGRKTGDIIALNGNKFTLSEIY
jgi:transcription elongation GreA/GreB family factor